MGLIIAMLLAITAGIITISMPRAAASEVQTALSASVDGPGDHAHPGADLVHEGQSHDHASAQADCDDPVSGSHNGPGGDCCNMGACHAVQILAAPMIHSPFGSAVSITMDGDEQVEGIVPGGLDRPPRTV